MLSRKTGRYRLLIAVAVFSVLGACSDVSAPSPDISSSPVPLPRMTSNQAASGSLLVITDHATGHQYALDVGAGQLTTTELPNHVVFLELEQLALLRTYFEGTIEADGLESELDSAANAWIPPGDVCPPQIADEPSVCVEPMRSVRLSDHEKAAPFVVRKASTHSLQPRANSDNHDWLGSSASTDVMNSLMPMSLGLDPCRDVVNALIPSRLEYRAQRAKPIQTMLGFAIVGEAANGVTGMVFPPGATSAASIMTMLAEDQARKVRLGVLAWQWNTYQCGGTREISAGPFIRGFGGADPRFVKVCFPEQWTLVWPDGRTKAITVEVCEYRKM